MKYVNVCYQRLIGRWGDGEMGRLGDGGWGDWEIRIFAEFFVLHN
ncbi:hypothetical protein ACP6PL_16370 [Dapis sp. BLCC M126]